MRHLADCLQKGVLPLALLGALLAVAVPSAAVSERSDLLLAGLVLLVALGIPPSSLARLGTRWRTVVVLSLGPLLVLGPLAYLLGRLFEDPVRDGVFALGLAPTEVAAAGLVALAGGEAALALAVVTGSLVCSALGGPLAAGLVAGGGAGGTDLLGRFALVVLVPLAAGLLLRAAVPRVGDAEAELAGAATLVLAMLVYAAIGSVERAGLAQAALGAALFLLVSLGPALLGAHLAGGLDQATPALSVGLRDFAVAAALASQAFGSGAAAVAGIYGVMMLIVGAVAAQVFRRRGARALSRHPAAQ